MKTKPVNTLRTYFMPIGLYPTFKEWKPDPDWVAVGLGQSLYPTFKEWKLSGQSLVVVLVSGFISYL